MRQSEYLLNTIQQEAHGSTAPLVSNLNFATGQTVPNLVTVKIGTLGQVSFANAIGAVDVIADVAGLACTFPLALWMGIRDVGIFAAMVVVSGLAVNAFMLVLARLGVGIARSNEFTVQGSLMADQYPIGTRGRVSAAMSIG